jgi:alpha-ketoglutarate-dependent taurine dioxygenase
MKRLTGFGFAAELADVDITALDASQVDELLRALTSAGVVVLPRQRLDAAAVESFADRLGIVEVVHPAQHRLPGTDRIRLQSNVPGVGVDGGGMYWHADGSWMARPTAATVLVCAEAPATGGVTSFVDACALYDHLDEPLRARVDGTVGVYPNRRTLARELDGMGIDDPAMLAATDDAAHPLARPHPVTGRRALILNEQWLHEIAGHTALESASLLADLSRVANETSWRYDHTWSRGQVVLWDNRRVIHRAAPVPPPERKVTWRATICEVYEPEVGCRA